jgi:hypothetical protein
MKQNQTIFHALIVFIIAVLLIGCKSDPVKVAIETDDLVKGIDAVYEVTDQISLTEIVLKAKLPNISRAALSKLSDKNLLVTDENLLVKVAWAICNDWLTCTALLKKITNQTLLLETAINDSLKDDCSNNVRRIAISCIKDPINLVKIAFESKNWYSRETAVQQLCDSSLLASIVNENANRRIKLIHKYLQAFLVVPYKNHRSDLALKFFPVICILNEPQMVKEYGEIITVKIKWERISQNYKNPSIPYWSSKTISGEKFSFSVKLEKLDLILSDTWETHFPLSVENDVEFIPADIALKPLLRPVLEISPRIALKNIINDSIFIKSLILSTKKKLKY